MNSTSAALLGEIADRYQIVVFWSEEDEAYVAACPDFRGHSAHGASPEEAVREGRIALELMIEGFLEHGDKLPEPRKVAA